jgi:hypothetical protein
MQERLLATLMLFAAAHADEASDSPRGASTEEINGCRKFRLSADSDDICCVCLDNMKKNQTVSYLGCSMCFCFKKKY